MYAIILCKELIHITPYDILNNFIRKEMDIYFMGWILHWGFVMNLISFIAKPNTYIQTAFSCFKKKQLLKVT